MLHDSTDHFNHPTPVSGNFFQILLKKLSTLYCSKYQASIIEEPTIIEFIVTKYILWLSTQFNRAEISNVRWFRDSGQPDSIDNVKPCDLIGNVLICILVLILAHDIIYRFSVFDTIDTTSRRVRAKSRSPGRTSNLSRGLVKTRISASKRRFTSVSPAILIKRIAKSALSRGTLPRRVSFSRRRRRDRIRGARIYCQLFWIANPTAGRLTSSIARFNDSSANQNNCSRFQRFVRLLSHYIRVFSIKNKIQYRELFNNSVKHTFVDLIYFY